MHFNKHDESIGCLIRESYFVEDMLTSTDLVFNNNKYILTGTLIKGKRERKRDFHRKEKYERKKKFDTKSLSFSHIENLAETLLCLLSHPKALGQFVGVIIYRSIINNHPFRQLQVVLCSCGLQQSFSFSFLYYSALVSVFKM